MRKTLVLISKLKQ